MTFKEYSEGIKNSLADYMKNSDNHDLYEHLALGIYEEVAEVVSPIRKTVPGNYHEAIIDKKHLEEEIGDVLWYIAQISIVVDGIDLSQIATDNLRKTYLIYKTGEEPKNISSISSYSTSVPETYKENLPKDINKRASYFSLGLIKEVGEISRIFGENGIDNIRLDIYKVKEKLGDALWYLSAICETYGMSLEEAARNNILKVQERYDKDGIATNIER